jgi:hypothetical protein
MITSRPFSVRECTKGTGGACGAIFITENFKPLLHRLLGAESKSILTTKRVNEAVKSFEAHIKFTFDPFTEYCESSFEIPLPGAPDRPGLKLMDGYLTVSK